jgi:predicted ribosome quality control (RQC) complex YloA/Tae2 family protein
MYLDAFTVSALVDEFLDTLVGGRIQDTLSVDDTGIGMEIYSYTDHRRYYLYLSADNRIPRVHIVDDKLRRGLATPTQLALLLRRYIEGGVIQHISQPAWERVIQFDIEGPEGEVSLIIEPMERRSNLLLVQNGIIVDCLRRVGPEENRYRLSLPNHEYVAPPPQTGKLNPLNVTIAELEQLFAANADPKRKAAQVLAGGLLGVSPLLAKEVMFRAHGEVNLKPDKVDIDAIHTALQAIVLPLGKRDWQPGMAETDGLIEAFSVYPLKHLDGWRRVDSISAAMAAYYGAPTGEEAYTAAKKPVVAVIAEARAKLSAKLASLQRSMKDESERELLKQSGELILAYQYTLTPEQTELRAQYEMDQPELMIEIDPALTPLENAQRYFDRYNRAKKALDDVPGLIKTTENELAYLAQLEMDLELATNWPEIDEVQQYLQSNGHWKGKTAKRIGGGGQSAPIRVVTKDGFVIWVGRNSRQNEMVSFKKASPEDFWLHARDVPGAHVIIKNDGRSIPERVIDQAAGLAAYYSGRRQDGKVPVDVTRIKYVRKIKGSGPGMVTYRNETTVTATPISDKVSPDAS